MVVSAEVTAVVQKETKADPSAGLIGLAATAIALGQDVAPYLGQIIPPVLACFQDPESRLRYHACESLYNM